MKKQATGIAAAFFIALGLTSCTFNINDGADRLENETPSTNGQVLSGSGTLKGLITQDLTIKKGVYNLEGIVKVTGGAKLIIEAGAVFKASNTISSALVVLQDGKIYANGTASEPIVFTSASTNPSAGDWGGVTLYGNAPIKALNGASSAMSEDGNNVRYGGNDAGHSSGVLKFVRVEYAGKKIGDGTSETNTFTFYSVGTGTTLENLVAYKGSDDGFEFFGGTASASNLVAYGNFDDSFDWQDAWGGQDNRNWYAFQTTTGNFGMEIEASSNVENTPPKVSGITLIRDANTNPETTNSPEISAIQFKKQGSGIFSNVYISGYKNIGNQKAYSVLIQDKATNDAQVANGNIRVEPINYLNSDNGLAWGYATTQAWQMPNPKTFTNANVSKVSLPKGAWATVNGVDLLSALD